MMAQNNTVEAEQKIEVPETSLEKVFNVLKPKDETKIKTKHYPRDYYDTDDLKLNAAKTAIRLQFKKKTGFEMTIKAAMADPSDNPNMLLRREWKFNVSENKPDFAKIDDADAAKSIAKVKDKDLKHIFISDVPRRYFKMDVTLPDGQTGVVELAFDRGTIKLSDQYARKLDYKKTETVCEIEVELISGPEKVVDFVVGKILSMDKDARISTVSKAEKGFNLYQKALEKHKNPKKQG